MVTPPGLIKWQADRLSDDEFIWCAVASLSGLDSNFLRKLSRLVQCQGTCLFRHVRPSISASFHKTGWLCRVGGGGGVPAFLRGRSHRKLPASLSVGEHSVPSRSHRRTKRQGAVILPCQQSREGGSDLLLLSWGHGCAGGALGGEEDSALWIQCSHYFWCQEPL